MKILVTGVLGFIGSHFVRYTLRNKPDAYVVGLDRNSSQKNKRRIFDYANDKRFELVYGDLTQNISGVLEGIDIVVNFAAETFVDASIKNPRAFLESNVVGTFNLLEQARLYKTPLFFHIGTDEVYGSAAGCGCNENIGLNPGNPYSASKAAADMFVMSYANTYDLHYIITRTENNYGSFQHLQKVIPTFVRNALLDFPLPVYGDGNHSRMWIRVEDHCSAIWHLIDNNANGIFNVGCEHELKNIDLAKKILRILNKPEDQIEFIDDTKIRPGHDRRYVLDCFKIRNLGWRPAYQDFDASIEEVVMWYIDNRDWLI